MLLQILKLRFSKDHRVAEVRRLLQSSHPVQISITQRPEVSDHEFIEEQEKHLYAICTRTMALPVGRYGIAQDLLIILLNVMGSWWSRQWT